MVSPRCNQFTVVVLGSIVLVLAVSSISAQMINQTGSLRSHAVGSTGATMIDHRSYTKNPASLALYAPA